MPRYLHVTDEFPMTVTGKVQKFEMREASIELLGLEGAAGRARRSRETAAPMCGTVTSIGFEHHRTGG